MVRRNEAVKVAAMGKDEKMSGGVPAAAGVGKKVSKSCPACGKPVVASPVGANRDIVTNEVGFLAGETDEWILALRALAADTGRRCACGAAARGLVERGYSLREAAPRMVELLREAAGLSKRKVG